MADWTIFQGTSETDLWDRVGQWWDVQQYSIPIPKRPLRCGQCQNHTLQLKMVLPHKSDIRTVPWRADVMFKCRTCSYTQNHGVPIPEEMHEDLQGQNNRWDRCLGRMIRRGEVSPDLFDEELVERALSYGSD